MAKRKRLTSPRADFLSGPEPVTATLFAAAPIAGIAGAAAASAAAEELGRTLEDARASGRMVMELPLDAVDPAYLVRDRIAVDEEEMAALMASIVARGQQTPIEVADLGQGRYGLISGWRRLEALKRLAPKSETILALLRAPEDAADAYLAMVEENEIRIGLSYYERGRIALKAVEQGVYPDIHAALRALFHAASRAKRSKIGSFARVAQALDGRLAHPAALGERLGLRLAQALEADPGLAERICDRLGGEVRDAATEQDLIAALIADTASRSKARKAPPPRRIGSGLHYAEAADGSVTLSGPRLDANLRADLLAWLEAKARD